MKKIFYFTVLMFLFSCNFSEWGDGKLSRNWYVENNTEIALVLKCPYSESILSNDFEYKEFDIAPRSSVVICSGKNLQKENVSWDYYLKKSAETLGEDVSWQLFSEDGALLKTWKYSNRELLGLRFFKNTEWDQNVELFSGYWIFRITSEDIQRIDQ